MDKSNKKNDRKGKRLPYKKERVAYIKEEEVKNDPTINVTKIKLSSPLMCLLLKSAKSKSKMDSKNKKFYSFDINKVD